MINLHTFLLILMVSVMLSNCQRVILEDESTPFSPEVRQVAPQPILDSLAKYGMPINPGTNPPLIEGIFFCKPNLITNSNYTSDKDSLNIRLYNPKKIRFQDQDQAKLTVRLDYKDFKDDAGTQPGGNQGGGVNGYLSGSGNQFSLFIEVMGSSQRVRNGKTLQATYKTLDIYSGEVTPSGIKGLNYSFFMKEKNDPDDFLVPVGTTRVFKDKDGFSEKVSTFRIAATEPITFMPARPSTLEKR